MNSFDAELARLRGEIARSEQLKKRLQSLYPRRDSLASQEAELREIRLEEDEDVQALEGRSLARYFYSLMGSLDERLDREREEAHAAAVKHDSVVRELADVDADIAETSSELKRLAGCEEKYEQAISHKAEALKGSGSPLAGKLAKLERELAEMELRRREATEAMRAGEEAREAAVDVIDDLESASNWGTIDLFSDSFLVNMAKHSNIDSAQCNIERLRIALRRFDTELEDIGASIDVNFGDFLGFADFFFDGLFVDMAVNSRIENALGNACDVLDRIDASLEKLAMLVERCKNCEERLDNEYEQLVTKA